MSDARHTARNAGWLLVQRGVHLLAAAVFGVFVPRLMGPASFGQFALLMSVAMWFGMLSGLGAVSLITRVVPQFTANDDRAGLRTLASTLVVLRGASGVVAALVYFAIIVGLAREIDPVAVTLMAAAVCCRAVANACFLLFLGMNRAARWGIGDVARHVLMLAGVLVGFPIAGLRGACAGVFAANVLVLAAGLVVARPYLRWSSTDFRREYLAPYLKIGTSFAVGNLLLALSQRSGETVVRIASHDYAQVGFFGAAYSAYFNGATILWQVGIAFAPLLVGLQHRDDRAAVSLWLGRLLKWMTVAAALVTLATLLVAGDLVPRLLGDAYRPVTRSLWPLALALFMMAASSAGRLGALVVDRPWLSAGAAASELAAFWTAGLLLAPRYGSEGVAWAVLCGTTAYAAVITWRTRDLVGYSPRAAVEAAGLLLPWLLLGFLRGGPVQNSALLVVAVTGYLALLLWRGVIAVDELRSLRTAMPGAGMAPPDVQLSEPPA